MILPSLKERLALKEVTEKHRELLAKNKARADALLLATLRLSMGTTPTVVVEKKVK